MKIETHLSGISSEAGELEAKQILEEALAQINPQYVELFEKIGGVISIEDTIRGGDQHTMGMSRFPRDIAIKTSEITKDNLDRILTEEIIHYLDYHLGFSDRHVFQMQEAANADADHPLSIGMITAVRGGTKGLVEMDDVFKDPHSISLMAEFGKTLPFLGVYSDEHNMNKYEWLTEVEHAERTLSGISDIDHAQLLSARAQQNLPIVMLLRFLSDKGIDIATESEKIANGLITMDSLKQRISHVMGQNDFPQWLEKIVDKVDISQIDVSHLPVDPLSKVRLAVAFGLMSDHDYPLSEAELRSTMITMFPESYYALQSFRDEVDRELLNIDRMDRISSTLRIADEGGDALKTHLASTSMDEVALTRLHETLADKHPNEAKAIKNTLQIYTLIQQHRPGVDEPTKQIKLLLDNAWPTMQVNNKTIMAHAAEKEMYSVAATIRDVTQKIDVDSSLPPH